MKPLTFLPLLLIAISAPLAAQDDERRYVLDDANSAVDAQVAFLGFGHKTARFPDMAGRLQFSIGSYSDIAMTVDVDARTLTTGDSETKRLRGKQFFDVANYPTVRFTGERMELTGERTAKVTGKVTARGVTRPVVLSVGFSIPPFETTGAEPLSIVARTTIDRRDFGMKAFPLIVGNKVAVTIHARMTPER